MKRYIAKYECNSRADKYSICCHVTLDPRYTELAALAAPTIPTAIRLLIYSLLLLEFAVIKHGFMYRRKHNSSNTFYFFYSIPIMLNHVH